MINSTILAQTNELDLDNIEKTEDGWYLTDEQMVELGNHIKEMEDYKNLAKERGKLIEDYEEQIDNYEEKEEKEQKTDNIQRLDDTLTGAGIASLIVLIAGAN